MSGRRARAMRRELQEMAQGIYANRLMAAAPPDQTVSIPGAELFDVNRRGYSKYLKRSRLSPQSVGFNEAREDARLGRAIGRSRQRIARIDRRIGQIDRYLATLTPAEEVATFNSDGEMIGYTPEPAA